MKMNEYDQWLLRQKQDAYAMEQHQIKGAIAGGNLGEQRMDKTFAAIEKLKEVELELHRLKNYAEMMNRSVEAQREWQGLTDEEIDQVAASFGYGYIDVARAIESKLQEKNT
jgi:hypothetical protein